MAFISSAFARPQTGQSLWQENRVYLGGDAKKIINALKKDQIEVTASVISQLENNKDVRLYTEDGQVSVLMLAKDTKKSTSFALARDSIGPKLSYFHEGNPKKTLVIFIGMNEQAINGAIVGIDLASYRFEEKNAVGMKHLEFYHNGEKLSAKAIEKISQLSCAINFARHLVNLPPNELHPVNFAAMIQKGFKNAKNIKVEVWDEKRLAKEKCGLHLGVGAASAHPPRLVKITYTPNKKTKKKISLIGKGITFDTGGLDIKPPAGMRMMKKDMGGAAVVAGVLSWLENNEVPAIVEGYLALAENAIDERATRPSDIHIARNGLKVEIDNTDAEGRLVLADTMDVACDGKPDLIIDAATLTGAGKVALGQDVASLFSNDDKLAKSLYESGENMGDPCWRMPLYQAYAKDLGSSFADCSNSASSGYAGSITAALFLQKFVRDIPWAHLDIFAWTTSNQPSLLQKGGSGQAVAMIVHYLREKL